MRARFKLTILLAPLVACIYLPTFLRAAEPAPHGAKANDVNFSRDIRPILVDICFACHGPDAQTRKAKLRLDRREAAIESAAIVPGNADESELVRRIFSDDPKDKMPPPKTKKRLSTAQKLMLRRWIDSGAEYTGHWAFIRPVRPEPPAVKNESWVRNAIDRFVLAKLEQHLLQPSPEADRRTLARRLSLDLIGLPPEPGAVERFVNDRSGNAYDRYVDELLNSPHYGERMAMQWLDGARYADSHGYEADYGRSMWRWRDWVIDAFNKNMPFDQFTIEQLAGDLLPNATLDQKIATGFHRNHRINTEDGTIAEEWRVENVVDRVDTTCQVWMGLTMGCARCHDHKYDPITQKEFYQLFAFFNNVPEVGNGKHRPGNYEPVIMTPRTQDIARLKQLDDAVTAAEATVKDKEKLLPALQAAWEPEFLQKLASEADPWVILNPSNVLSFGGARLTKLRDGSYLVSGANPARDVYTVSAPAPIKWISGILLDVLPHESLAAMGFGRSGNGNVVLSGFQAELRTVRTDGASVTMPIKLTSAKADYERQDWTIDQALKNRSNHGWAVDGDDPAKRVPRAALFVPDKPIEIPTGATLFIHMRQEALDQHCIGRFRLSVTNEAKPALRLPEDVLEAFAIEPAKRTPRHRDRITGYFRAHFAGPVTAADKALAAARQARDTFEATLPTVMIMAEMPSTPTTAESSAAQPTWPCPLAHGSDTSADGARGRQPNVGEVLWCRHRQVE
jgi:hypothetical protein